MALWNDLSKKVSDTKDKTVQQAKVLMETNRLSNMIAEEKKKLDDRYRELGEQYAQAHPEDYEEDFGEVMAAILASEAVIRDIEAQIRDIKGLKCCEVCGTELPKDALSCSGCGAVIPKFGEAAAGKCTACGAAMAEGSCFCTTCGTPVTEEEAEESSEEETERICPVCGELLEADMEVCPFCGE